MVDPYAIVRRLTGHELISPKDARLLTEAVDGLIDEIGSKDARIAELEAENKRLKQELASTQEKLIKANDELIQRRAEALSRTGAVKVDDIDRRAKEAAAAIGVTPYSDMRLFVEQAAKYALSALSPAPEAQQERPSEQAVTEAMELARSVLAQSITAGHNVPGPTPEDIEKAFWALDAALSLPPSHRRASDV